MDIHLLILYVFITECYTKNFHVALVDMESKMSGVRSLLLIILSLAEPPYTILCSITNGILFFNNDLPLDFYAKNI